MDLPTAETVRLRTPRLDWSAQGYPADASPDLLEEEVADACEYIVNTTGHTYEAMPSNLERTALKATIMRTQQQVFQADPDNVESAADELTQSFSAGSYSESRRSFGEVKTQNEAGMVNSWPELNRLLWALMTAEKRAYWMGLLSGQGQPAYGVVEVDWSSSGASAGDDPLEHGSYSELADPYKQGPWPWGL
jgi:hypothetical protein